MRTPLMSSGAGTGTAAVTRWAKLVTPESAPKTRAASRSGTEVSSLSGSCENLYTAHVAKNAQISTTAEVRNSSRHFGRPPTIYKTNIAAPQVGRNATAD